MTPQLLCGSSPTSIMGPEVGTASGKLPAWYACVLVSDESPPVTCCNYKAIKVDRVFSSLDLCLRDHTLVWD